MGNWNKVKEEVLFKCKRYCCMCEEYKGTNIEVHHIIQKADGGKDTIVNAIPLCFNCHAEVGSYNPHHPKGNKYSVNELKRIRDEFYSKVKNMPRKKSISDEDMRLLEQFKNDYTDIMEYCIRTDFTVELIEMDLHGRIDDLNDKWTYKKRTFEDITVEKLKEEILHVFEQLNKYLTFEFLRYHEGSGKLIFRNQSWEEGCKLRNDFQPNSIRLRKKIKELLDSLYLY